MTPQERRNDRLKSDYQEMCNLRGGIISWHAVRGTPPYVEAYRLVVNVKSVVGKEPTFRDQHVIDVENPAGYPVGPGPTLTMISEPLVFHPNWWPSPRRFWCGGPWDPTEGLGRHVVRMVRTLQYDSVITNEDSAANTEAKLWYLSRRDQGIFPCDRQRLPHPSNTKFEIQAKNKFEIL